MTNPSLTSDPPDICLILRAHAEQLWLTAQVLPTLRQLEQPGQGHESHVGAALAYLEVTWLDACERAAESDGALEELLRQRSDCDEILYHRAQRYHAAVRRLRVACSRRVDALIGVRCHAHRHEHAGS